MKRKALRQVEVETAAQALRKRIKPQPTEYLEEPRRLEGLWKAAYPAGTPRSVLDSPLYHSIKWDFSNLEGALEEGGELYKKSSKVYLFGATEKAIVEKEMFVLIPVVVAVISESPPSNALGLVGSVGEVETIIPMKRLKMDWEPYIPLDESSRVDKEGPEIFVLSSKQRRAALKHRNVGGNGDLVKFEYAVPYLDSAMQVMCDEVHVEEEYFSANDDELDELYFSGADENKVIEEVENMKVEEEEKTGENTNLGVMEGGRRTSVEDKMKMRMYKFYPVQTPATPDISEFKTRFVNRYYGTAYEIL